MSKMTFIHGTDAERRREEVARAVAGQSNVAHIDATDGVLSAATLMDSLICLPCDVTLILECSGVDGSTTRYLASRAADGDFQNVVVASIEDPDYVDLVVKPWRKRVTEYLTSIDADPDLFEFDRYEYVDVATDMAVSR